MDARKCGGSIRTNDTDELINAEHQKIRRLDRFEKNIEEFTLKGGYAF